MSKPIFTRSLGLGDEGDDVAALQLLLWWRNPGLQITGLFDEATQKAVRGLQQHVGFPDPKVMESWDGAFSPELVAHIRTDWPGRDLDEVSIEPFLRSRKEANQKSAA